MNAFRKILHSIFLTTNFGVVLFMLISGFAYIVKPEHSALSSFLVYGFPLLMLANLFFIFYWAFRLKGWVLVSLVGFLLTLGSAQAWFPLHFKKEVATVETFKVLSYNVGFLTHATVNTSEGLNPIIEYIRDLDPDIVCLQEVGPDFIQKEQYEEKNKIALKSYPYLISGEDENRYSVVLLSKYPVIKHERIRYESKSNSSFFYDLKIGKDTIRVINNHLESNKLNSEEKDKYTDLIRKRESNQITAVAETLGIKVGNATVIRANQAVAVSAVIRDSPYKVIVCGDFNDVPGSYTYRKIRGKLLDAWVEKGNGWGHTFRENLFLFRIDYILYPKEIRCIRTKVDHVYCSDHYPIWANLQLP
jgi:endonuclease/exonuclease/phosphatase family metal-dependent hydrolase